ncbi:MAG: PAS domain S-box protein, partial [Nitrospiria bacterium]
MPSKIAFETLLDFMPDAVVAVDREGRITLVNTLTEQMFGYSREELIGEPIE